MTQVIQLNLFRKKKKQQFFEKNKSLLDDFIRGYIASQGLLSYEVFQRSYLENCHYQNEQAWDYLDFRDTLSDAISEVIGEQIWKEVQGQSWFKPQFLSKDEVMDRLISIYIIGAAVSGIE